jgi:hypothetical protein
MRSRDIASLLRWLVVLLVATGSLVLSTHCALGMGPTSTPAAEAHQCCQYGNELPDHGHTAPDGSAICCKAIDAVTPDSAALADLNPALITALVSVAWVLDLEPQEESPGLRRSGTVPPRLVSFSELVLQRSLLAHAPPTLI